MKKALLLIVIFFFILPWRNELYSQNFWYKLVSPTENRLRTLHFEDSSKGWVAGDSGLILYTSNGGLDWVQQESNTERDIQDIFFLDENRGWGLAWNEGYPPYATFILKTTNGGNDWTIEQYHVDNVYFFAIYFLDTLNGFMGGAPGGAFVRTIDGGVTWDTVSIKPIPLAYFPVKRIKFYNSLYGYATGGRIDISGVIWKTTDGGGYWVPMDTAYNPPDEIWDIHFIDSLNILACGGDPEFYGVAFLRSTDAGNSWDFNEIGFSGVAKSMSFRKDNEGWATVPLSEALLFSSDTGSTWTVYPTPNISNINEIVFTDTSTGYGVGDGGVIIKYKYPIVNSYSENDKVQPQQYKLYQNYPNPFNLVTTIRYYLPMPAEVELSIYDLLGREVKLLFEGYQQKGEYSFKWDAEEFPSGIYYLHFSANTFSDAKKIILLK